MKQQEQQRELSFSHLIYAPKQRRHFAFNKQQKAAAARGFALWCVCVRACVLASVCVPVTGAQLENR